MKIKLELASLTNSLDIVSRLAPPTSGNITVVSDGKKVKILSANDLNRCITVVPCDVDKAGEFAIPLQALKDAIKGRNELELTYKNTTLTITSKQYRADLTTVDVVPLDDIEDEDGKEIKLAAEQSAWLRTALRDVALKPTTIFSAWMPVGIRMTDKAAFVCCFDSQHMSWTISKDVKGDFECVMPIETMTSVIDLFHKAPFIMRQARSRVEIKTKHTQVYMSMPSLEDLPSLDDVYGKVREASKMDASTFKLNTEQILTFMNNARSVIGKERAEIQLAGAGKNVEVSIGTSMGTAKAQVEGAGKGKFRIDYEYLMEVLGKVPEEVLLNVVEDAFVSLKLKTSSVIIALNQ